MDRVGTGLNLSVVMTGLNLSVEYVTIDIESSYCGEVKEEIY